MERRFPNDGSVRLRWSWSPGGIAWGHGSRCRAARSVHAPAFAMLALFATCAVLDTKGLTDLHASEVRPSDRTSLEDSPIAEYTFKEAGPDDEAARRFARLVATDIRLYNEESVILGRRNADLSHRLKEQLERGKETFQRRFPDLGEHGERILWEAYVKVLAGGDPKLFAAE